MAKKKETTTKRTTVRDDGHPEFGGPSETKRRSGKIGGKAYYAELKKYDSGRKESMVRMNPSSKSQSAGKKTEYVRTQVNDKPAEKKLVKMDDKRYDKKRLQVKKIEKMPSTKPSANDLKKSYSGITKTSPKDWKPIGKSAKERVRGGGFDIKGNTVKATPGKDIRERVGKIGGHPYQAMSTNGKSAVRIFKKGEILDKRPNGLKTSTKFGVDGKIASEHVITKKPKSK